MTDWEGGDLESAELAVEEELAEMRATGDLRAAAGTATHRALAGPRVYPAARHSSDWLEVL